MARKEFTFSWKVQREGSPVIAEGTAPTRAEANRIAKTHAILQGSGTWYSVSKHYVSDNGRTISERMFRAQVFM